MQGQKTGLSPKLRPKGSNLLNPGGQDPKMMMEMHERVYRMIMENGQDVLKEAYQPILAELMIEITDILDKKFDEFKKPGKREPDDIIQVRFDFYHERREYKLLQISDLIAKKKQLNQWQVQGNKNNVERKKIEKGGAASN